MMQVGRNLTDVLLDANKFDLKSAESHPGATRYEAFARQLSFLTIRVRSESRDLEFLDVAAECVAGQQTTGDVVEPETLAHFVQFSCRSHNLPPEQDYAALVWPA